MPQLVKVEKFSPSRIRGEDSGNRVVYESRNSKDKTSFVAYSSPNSPHAAQLAQIALAVQSDGVSGKDTSRRGFLSAPVTYVQRQLGIAREPEQPRQLIASEESYQRIQSTLPPPTDSEFYQKNDSVVPEPREIPVTARPLNIPPVPAPQQPTYYYPTQSGSSITTSIPVSIISSAPYQVSSSQVTTFVRPIEVTRQSTEERTAYTVRSANGKLFVSAPIGSSEAQTFDDVARLGSEQNMEPLSENRAVVANRHRHKRRSRRSSR